MKIGEINQMLNGISYVLGTIHSDCVFDSDEKDWAKVHRGRLECSYQFLQQIEKRLMEEKKKMS